MNLYLKPKFSPMDLNWRGFKNEGIQFCIKFFTSYDECKEESLTQQKKLFFCLERSAFSLRRKVS